MRTQHQTRVERTIQAHDRELDGASHPTLQVRLKALEDHWAAHNLADEKTRLNAARFEQDLKELYWFRVGEKAAELEPDWRRRAQAARDARERFERYVNSGKCLKDAYTRTLETPPPR
jgi:hypothetical protein